MAGFCKSRERSLHGDEDEAVELFGLRLIVADDWEAVGDDGVNLSHDQLTDGRKSRMLPSVDDPADAVHCIANSLVYQLRFSTLFFLAGSSHDSSCQIQ